MREALELALNIAKPFEGLSLVPYYDPIGYPTIGYGHLLSLDAWGSLDKYSAIDAHEAERLLMADMLIALTQATAASPVLLKTNNTKRLAAITDFVFNLGIGKYKASTLRKKVDAENWDAAKEQIIRWNRAGGKLLKGLTLRRQAEAGLL